jgi:hypothetical protein
MRHDKRGRWIPYTGSIYAPNIKDLQNLGFQVRLRRAKYGPGLVLWYRKRRR